MLNQGTLSIGITLLVRNFDDTWHMAGGAQFKPLKAKILTACVGYDRRAVKSQYCSVAVPMGETYLFGLGAQWQFIPAARLGFSYEYALTPVGGRKRRKRRKGR